MANPWTRRAPWVLAAVLGFGWVSASKERTALRDQVADMERQLAKRVPDGPGHEPGRDTRQRTVRIPVNDREPGPGTGPLDHPEHTDTGGPPPSREGMPMVERSSDGPSESIREEMEQRKEDSRNAIVSKVHDTIDEVSRSYGLEEDVVASLHELFDDGFEAREDLRAEVLAGDLSRSDARDEHERMLEEDRELLEELVGVERAEELGEAVRDQIPFPR